jgi:aspartate kinase
MITDVHSPRDVLVEKIGGTSMTRFNVVLKNVIRRPGVALTNRLIVVSAYAGITDLLLEHKKQKTPGIYHRFQQGESISEALVALENAMIACNESFVKLGLNLKASNNFVLDRITGTATFLEQVKSVLAYGYVDPSALFGAARELLAGVGESHSAYVTTQILLAQGIPSVCVDLGGWQDSLKLTIDERIRHSLSKIDIANNLVIVTGYCKGTEGIMRHFDRGYSEVTFSRLAVLCNALEAIIHKEYHLSSADPLLVGPGKVKPIGRTNFDVADQMADVGMEAIHPKASKPLERAGIPVRVRNIFEVEHEGTLITRDFCSEVPRVEIVSGCREVTVVEVHDTEMVGEVGFDFRIMKILNDFKISYLFKTTNANTISMAILTRDWNEQVSCELKKLFESVITTSVSLIVIIGSNLENPFFLARAASALAAAKIHVKAVGQATRCSSIQFLIDRSEFEKAQIVLHAALCEGL